MRLHKSLAGVLRQRSLVDVDHGVKDGRHLLVEDLAYGAACRAS